MKKEMNLVELKKMYIGKRIEMSFTLTSAVKKGMRGYVFNVDNNGFIHVECDNGDKVRLVHGGKDIFSILDVEPMKALVVYPQKHPMILNIDNSLTTLQKIVGGLIDEIYLEDEIAIILNDEGKLIGLDLNRALFNEEGEMVDIVAGPFVICSVPMESEHFESLSDKLLSRYQDKFYYPETFFINDGIKMFRNM